jgi:hypothetical protein
VRLKRLFTPFVLVVAFGAAALTGCGVERDKTFAESEAIALEIGGLVYQVQISRQLNPGDAEDRGYLVDLAPNIANLTPAQTWFGVFIRSFNNSDRSLTSASRFEIVDTTDTVFKPTPLGPKNVFAYRMRTLAPDDTIPPRNSAAIYGPTQGELLLFKLSLASLENRPLELRVYDPQEPKRISTFTLDV